MTQFIHHDAIDSTNKEAHRIVKSHDLPKAKLKSGIVITANQQTEGIGRENRTWHSAPNGGLYYTLILQPKPLEPDTLKTLSIEVAKRVQTLIQQYSHTSPILKWPNDILLNNRKLGGILIDCISSSSNPSPHIMIIGIGLNLNQSFFPEPYDTIATSLFLETGQHADKDRYISSITTSLIDWLGHHE